MTLMGAVADEIEPDAKALIGEGADDALVAAASIAISLRRIADGMARGFTDEQVALAVEHARREGIIG